VWQRATFTVSKNGPYDPTMSEPTPQPLFDAVLYPHRSLSPRGFAILMAACAGLPSLVGLWFATHGAWPVLPFFGCEIVLIWWAFHANNRDARSFETVRLTPEELTVERVRPSGHRSAHRFAPPHWLRIELASRPDGGNTLRLASHGRSIEVGRFLTPEERREFAGELRAAIARLIGRQKPV
jgi:uncharacterized membrane protein